MSLGTHGLFWTSTLNLVSGNGWGRYLTSENHELFRGTWYHYDGMSVRCVKD
jgi:hypothetical protein